jgi:Ssp1 endopeptidase immunity protein Rap1a
MFTIRRAVGAIVLAWCVSATATPTGNELAERCDRSAVYCLGYISGVVDVEQFGIFERIRVGQLTPADRKVIEVTRELARKNLNLKNTDQLKPFQLRLIGLALVKYEPEPGEHPTQLTLRACIPGDATRQQLTDVVTKHLRDNPTTRHHPAHMLVVDALATAFPCY